MSLIYHRRSTTFRDSIVIQNPDGTFVTGLTDASFTKKLSKDGTGNQSTSGITITEVSAANNPGEYEVEVASSAFVAADGAYTLVITRTASPAWTFEQVIIVNALGTPEATPASFTSTASDGRVTNGTTAISGATVYLTSGSTFWTQVTTAADGNWGPVYLTDGTYTVRAQASGYAQGSATITVSGSTVTGPGADIALTAGSTTNPLSAAQLWAYARRMAVDQTGTKADAIIKGAVNDALDMVSSERQWPHLLRSGTLDLKGPYSTGTIAISGTTVTLTGGTWPSWAANGKLFVRNQIIEVSTRDSNSALSIASAWAGETISGQSYTLYQNEYDLPDDLWRFHQNLPGQRWGWGATPRGPADVLNAEAAFATGQSFPDVFTVANGAFMCWPYPQNDAVLRYTYYARPARLVNDTDVADWDPVHLEVLKRAIDYQLARVYGKVLAGDAATTLAAYKEALGRDAVQDKSPTDIPAVGNELTVGLSRMFDWKRRQS